MGCSSVMAGGIDRVSELPGLMPTVQKWRVFKEDFKALIMTIGGFQIEGSHTNANLIQS